MPLSPHAYPTDTVPLCSVHADNEWLSSWQIQKSIEIYSRNQYNAHTYISSSVAWTLFKYNLINRNDICIISRRCRWIHAKSMATNSVINSLIIAIYIYICDCYWSQLITLANNLSVRNMMNRCIWALEHWISLHAVCRTDNRPSEQKRW